MNVFTNYLEKLGSNFLVSAMVPALALVVASILVFDPIIPVTALFAQKDKPYELVGFGLLLFILTVIIGFTLTALNTYILKLFEGYVFFHRIPFMYKRMINYQRRRADRLIRRQATLKKRIDVVEDCFTETDRTKRIKRKLRQEYYKITSEYDHSYPPNIGEVLPTQFGNILKASELYPGTRYGLDGVEFWPRLLYVIPPEYQQKIDNSRNELSFLVNMSILCIAFYLFCVVAIFYYISIASATLSDKALFFDIIKNALRYIVAGLIALGLNRFFNRAAIFSVSSFGLMIRSAYDLFRLDLLKQFKLKRPTSSVTEFSAWKNLNELVVLGKHSLNFKKLVYRSKD